MYDPCCRAPRGARQSIMFTPSREEPLAATSPLSAASPPSAQLQNSAAPPASAAVQPPAPAAEGVAAQRMAGMRGTRRVLYSGLATLLLLWGWLYARFVGKLYFVLDDFIETEAALSKSWARTILDSFTGDFNWSGYRPLAYAVRVTLVHLFGMRQVWVYYAFGMALLLAAVLLTFHLVRSVSRSDLWAFVAAGVLLLLPAHNEGVLFMSGNANLMALLLALCVVEAVRRVVSGGSAPSRRSLWRPLAWSAFALGLLVYEVILPLPFVLAAGHWAALRWKLLPRYDEEQTPATLRSEWPLYAGLLLVAVGALALRAWAGAGELASGRADYGLSLAPAHLLHGYQLFLGQLVLLQSSPWIHLVPASDLREWMAPTNPRALASMALAAAGTLTTFLLALRNRREVRSCRLPAPLLWLLWGLLWVTAMALPFAALVGRNPENRYTLIPSFGFAVAVAAAAAWLAGPLTLRTAGARLRQWGTVAAITLLFAYYAFVTTSDVAEWERASLHTRTFVTQAPLLAQALPLGAGVAQVGVPASVGGAYVFSTAESFQAAMHMAFGGVEPVISSDIWLREVIARTQGQTAPLVGFGYDRVAHQVALLDSAWACGTECVGAAFEQPQSSAAGATPWIYAQVYNEAAPEQGGLGLLLGAGADGSAQTLHSCWAFFDVGQVQIDPAGFDEDALRRRCEATGQQLIASGALHLLATPPSP